MEIPQILNTHLPFFTEPELKEKIQAHGKIMEFPADTTMLNEGSYVKVIPILLEGLIKVVKYDLGKEVLLYYIEPLESCIVSFNCSIKNEKSNVKAITETASKMLVLPSFEIASWKNIFPSFNQYYLSLYHKRFYNLLDAYNSVVYQQLDQRILSYIESKAKALNSNKLQMTHQELGNELGAARETTSRLLKKLENEKKLKLSRGCIELING